ncbi:MAG TPA: site-specific integrase [Pseudomonadota bacterium]|nr:site-specific integrase [Pseudomonadota bacterium]
MQVTQVHGPYRDHKGIRLVLVYSDGRKDSRRGFATEGEAQAVKKELLRQIEEQRGVSIRIALDQYREYLVTVKGNKTGSIATTLTRLRDFFIDLDRSVAALTPKYCRDLYEALTKRPSARTGKPVTADTHRNALAEARTFLAWCVQTALLKANPLQAVHGIGRRQHGKAQLRVDEAKLLTNKALELAALGNDGAVAMLVALLMGLRASEIISRQVRDFDDGGRVLWVERGKTAAAQRRPEVPDVLRPHLQRLAQGKGPGDKLFGHHDRCWVRECTQKICDQAGLPRVTAHGLRGMCSTLAIDSGQASHAVAAMLGHASPTVTEQSYMAPGTKEARGQRELLQRVKPAPAPVRSCRVCGCTDKDCSQCVARTGQPCRWVAEDLCSACL